MSDIRTVMLAFLVIATCGNSSAQRTLAWLIVTACAVTLLVMWLVGEAVGIEVE